MRSARRRGRRRWSALAGAIGLAAAGPLAVACEAPPPPPASYTTLTYKVATGGVVFPAASYYWVDPARPEVSFEVDPALGCGATLLEDHLELGYGAESGWSLTGGSIVAQVRNSPDCLNHDHHVLVLTTVLHFDDDSEDLAETYVVPADSYMAGAFNDATLVK